MEQKELKCSSVFQILNFSIRQSSKHLSLFSRIAHLSPSSSLDILGLPLTQNLNFQCLKNPIPPLINSTQPSKHQFHILCTHTAVFSSTPDILGLPITQNLNWKPHISSLPKLASFRLGVLNRLHQFRPIFRSCPYTGSCPPSYGLCVSC